MKNNNKKLEKNKYKLYFTISIVFFMFVFLLSFCLGHYKISFFNDMNNKTFQNIIYNIRFPRIVIASIVGGGLAISGAAFQGVFSNPLCSPSILGASNAAGFGATLGILLNFSNVNIILISFLFSLLSIFFVFFIAKLSKGFKIINIILSGVMISSLFSAGISFIKLVADPHDKLPKITYWLMGSLSGANNSQILFVLIPVVIGIVPIYVLRWKLNILTLDESEARSLGINVKLVRNIILLSATLITAACVSVSGMIGFVGLTVPHFTRKIVGDNYKYVIPMSIILGATFLLIVDNISRNLLLTEIPIGILTSLIGVPFFIYLITKKQDKNL